MNTAMQEPEFHSQAQIFLTNLFKDLENNGLTLRPNWDIDHICFRSDSQEDYESLKQSFSHFGSLLIESVVGGRLISTFKLNTPLLIDDWKIHLVELPAPKVGKIVDRGFEHIEVVFDLPFEEFEKSHPHLNFDKKGLTKNFNRELEVCLGSRNIKFHHSSLESVIQIEKNKKVWDALNESMVLEIFKHHHPLVAGTFPLGIETSESDIDVLMQSSDLASIEKELMTLFSKSEGLETKYLEVDGLKTLLCNFTFKNVPFEIFVQDRAPVKQTAYRHFLVEERLLKLGGNELREKIMTKRQKGLKTEPAFAKALELEGDPYQELLVLQLSNLSGIKF